VELAGGMVHMYSSKLYVRSISYDLPDEAHSSSDIAGASIRALTI
jgi:hypothetical protein